MYSSPALRARVVMPPGFDPKPGSVKPKHPSFSPFSSGSHLLFCSSAKRINRIHHQRRLHTHKTATPSRRAPAPASPAHIPRSTSRRSHNPRASRRRTPRSPIGSTNSRGKRPSRLHCSMIGTRLSSMNWREYCGPAALLRCSTGCRIPKNRRRETLWRTWQVLVSVSRSGLAGDNWKKKL